ncbi:uncharacterized protein [Rutidosis leptorrhynchoides]|uniref:uncharacterized protein n=1 Tax=Rutidosis leptorrhynchoides TaxID=125765 RepID=UPI003A9A3E38
MKEYIAKLPTLTSPEVDETLFIYLDASKECISIVLVTERERAKVPIYFVSRVLQGAELNYPELEKLTLALVHTARKLRRYFQAHQIVVLTNKPIRQVLSKLEKSGRMAKWAIELGEHDIEFRADALSKLASLAFEHLAKEVLVEVLEKKSILEEEVNDLIQEDEVTWMTPLQAYLESGKLPEDRNEARKIRIKAPSYKIMNGALCRRSFLTPWLRCVGPKQETIIIQEMHDGICGLHAGPRLVVTKIMRLGYYWPTMHHDTTMILQTCESCQIHSNVPRLPKQELISVTSAWPFVKWGIDIVGPISDTPGSPRFLLVRSPPRNSLRQWETIRRRNIPKILRTIENPAKLHFSISSTSNGETPYSLAYGTEAVLPAEIQVLTQRTAKNENNEVNLRVNLDLLEERREAAVIREASYKRMIKGYYNKRVKPSTFKVGEYVLRLNSASKVEYEGKLGPNWEGSYVIAQVLGKGSYKLETTCGKPIPRAWNATNLKKFYH